MAPKPGHNPGQRPEAGWSWGDYLAALVAELGTLTAVAWKLGDPGDDVASIERALRRLRSKGSAGGGTWGARLLRVFGMPRTIEQRLRWMGLYHSPFNDLPVALCLDQLRLWDRPPASESRARVWLHLGFASVALRGRDWAEAETELARAAAARPPDDARVEIALARAYLASKRDGDDDGAGHAELEAAEALLAATSFDTADRLCFRARLVDHRAFRDNRRGDHASALRRYQALPARDEHPFASYRRDAGLAYGHLKLGDPAQALICARRACDHAGDGGYIRLRVMALLLVARIEPGPAAAATLDRATAIATRLDDGELLTRIARARSHRA